MPATVIVGLQWGDEGKGKTTDFLAEQVAMVVRYQGGDNAGHTVVSGDEVFKLHLVPSGVLYPHITSVIGSGVVVNPATLISELDMLAARGIDTSRVRVSAAAHVIMPYHVALDRAQEARLGDGKVGTTGRGIGPAYADRAWRVGLRMEDLLDAATRPREAREGAPRTRTSCSRRRTARRRFTIDELVDQAAALGRAPPAAHRRRDVARPGGPPAARPRPARGRPGHAPRPRPRLVPVRDLVEPGRGRRLHGRRDRPAPGRRGPRRHEGVLDAGRLRARSRPSSPRRSGPGSRRAVTRSGTTTGRPRRVGWFDAVPLRYAVAVNSVSAIMLNKLDILSGVDPIRMCVAYEVDGRRVEAWPSSATVLAGATPVYEEFEGWSEPIHDVRSLGDLPENARRYVSALEAAGRRADRAAVGRARADPDDRAGLAADPPAPGGRGMSAMPVMPTRILIVGGGGREHALAWKLAAGAGRERGRGRARIRRDRPRGRASAAPPDVDPLDPAAIVALARERAVELVVIGPEAPLAAGVADALADAGIAVFGPSAAAARIETSKSFCHEVAAAAGVAMARSASFDDAAERAAAYARDGGRPRRRRRRQGRRARGGQGRGRRRLARTRPSAAIDAAGRGRRRPIRDRGAAARARRRA